MCGRDACRCIVEVSALVVLLPDPPLAGEAAFTERWALLPGGAEAGRSLPGSHRAPAVPDSLSTVVEVPLADAPRDGVGLCASLLGQDGDDLPRAGLGAIESLGDEDDPAADLLKLIEDQANLCHAAPREPVDLGDVQGSDPPVQQDTDGLLEAGPVHSRLRALQPAHHRRKPRTGPVERLGLGLGCVCLRSSRRPVSPPPLRTSPDRRGDPQPCGTHPTRVNQSCHRTRPCAATTISATTAQQHSDTDEAVPSRRADRVSRCYRMRHRGRGTRRPGGSMAGGHVEYDGGRMWYQEAARDRRCCCCTRAGQTAACGTGTWSGSRGRTARSASICQARAPPPSPTSRTCPTTCSSGCWTRWGSTGRRWWGCRPAAGWRSTPQLSGRSGPGRWWWSPLVRAASMTSRRTRACKRSPRRSWRGTATSRRSGWSASGSRLACRARAGSYSTAWITSCRCARRTRSPGRCSPFSTRPHRSPPTDDASATKRHGSPKLGWPPKTLAAIAPDAPYRPAASAWQPADAHTASRPAPAGQPRIVTQPRLRRRTGVEAGEGRRSSARRSMRSGQARAGCQELAQVMVVNPLGSRRNTTSADSSICVRSASRRSPATRWSPTVWGGRPDRRRRHLGGGHG